jgi:hypothetical protein
LKNPHGRVIAANGGEAIEVPRSCVQSGRTLAPRWPHFPQRILGPNDGTATSSGKVSTLILIWWPHFVQVTSGERGAEATHVAQRHRPAGLVSLAMRRNQEHTGNEIKRAGAAAAAVEFRTDVRKLIAVRRYEIA